MRHYRLAFIACLLFLATQLVSMVGGMSTIGALADLDNIDDISLEDIVPLDPFLGSTGGQSSGSVEFGQASAVVASLVVLLFLCIKAPVVQERLFGQYNAPPEGQLDLWLVNRVLLI